MLIAKNLRCYIEILISWTIHLAPCKNFPLSCHNNIIIISPGAYFGFEVTSLRTGESSRQLLEGEAAEVCVLLLDPEELTSDVEMIVELSEGEDLLRGWDRTGISNSSG